LTIPSLPRGGGLDPETWECGKGHAVGFVLAGGQSRRMGTDKALVEFRGRPLVAHAVDLLCAVGLPVFIAGARSPLESYAPVIPDFTTDAGPLGGICAALESLKDSSPCLAAVVSAPETVYAVFLSVDLPLLPPLLLRYLLYHACITGSAVTLPSVNGFPQTFPVVLSLDALPVLKHELSSGQGGCYAAFQATSAALGKPVSILPAEVLVQSRKIAHPAALPVSDWFLNVNAPADLRRASTMGAGRVS
jgi:molybdopterin-guanine dinucleotide biosynthesis protein A